MWKTATLTLALSLLLGGCAATTRVNTPDQLGAKTLNTGANALVGWADCGKGIADEVRRARERFWVGIAITAPVSCAGNLIVRYLGVVADLATLPWGDNIVKPSALDGEAAPFWLP